jgi:hypothetical protein
MLNANFGKEISRGDQRRLMQRARRVAIFEAWDKNPSFAAVGRELGLPGRRVRQIVWKAVVSDGCRSDRARAWMARLDTDGYWLRRYEADFRASGRAPTPTR